MLDDRSPDPSSPPATRPATPLAVRAAGGGARPFVDAATNLASTVRGYNAAKLRGDLVSGVTVAAVAVPQAMAYALIAGLEGPEMAYGLYTVIFQCLIGALFNSHPLLSVGPINSQSLVVASIVTRLVDGSGQTYLTLVITLTLVKGLLQLGMASLQLGMLARYVSQSVIVGFTAGAGMLIAAGQLPAFLGVSAPRASGDLPGLIGIIQRLSRVANDWHLEAIALGVAALAIVIGGRKLSRLFPGPLVAVVATAAVVAVVGWTPADFRLVGEVPRFPDQWPIPSFSPRILEMLIPGGIALGLLGLMEAYSIGKTLSTKTGDRVSANRELFSQGLTNAVTSFLGSIPGSGSFSRSALNHYAGGRTLFANVFNSVFVALIFLVGADAARHIPMSAIAAVLFVIAYGLVDWTYIRRAIRTSKAESAVLAGTFIATLTIPLEYAVLVGFVMNIALYLRRAAQLQIREMVQTAAGPFLEKPLSARSGDKPVVFLQAEGDLFFALADELDDRLTALANSPVRVVVIRLKRTHSFDATVLGVFDRFVRQMHERGKHVVLCGVRPELLDKLDRFGIADLIGRDNIFEVSYGVFTSAKQGLLRARKLLGESIDADDVIEEDEAHGWAYQI